MSNKLNVLILSSLFVVVSVGLSADRWEDKSSWGDKGDRGRHRGWESGKHEGWDQWKGSDHWKWKRHFGWPAWDMITHPGTSFAKADVAKKSNGTYELSLNGTDFAARATFPVVPNLKEPGQNKMRYQAFSPRTRTVYSLLFVKDRVAAGFAATHEDAMNELTARYSSLGETIKVEPVSGLRKPNTQTAGRLDNYTGYQLSKAESEKQSRGVSMQVAERVIMIDNAMVIASVAGPKLGPEAMEFLDSVDLTVINSPALRR